MSIYVFDVDGTLLDSMPVWENLGERYLEQEGKEAEPHLSDVLRSMSYEQSADYLKKNYLPEKAAEQIQQEIEEMISGFYQDLIRAKPGVGAYLKRLKDKGNRLVVASSSRKQHIESAFKRLGFLEYFEAIYTSRELGPKDSVEFYKNLACQLGVQAKELIVWEDALYAAASAKEAGCLVYAVYDELEPDGERLRQLADRYIADFREIKL